MRKKNTSKPTETHRNQPEPIEIHRTKSRNPQKNDRNPIEIQSPNHP
jgi:hypothetical protein